MKRLKHSKLALVFEFEDGQSFEGNFPNLPPFNTMKCGSWHDGDLRGKQERFKLISRRPLLRRPGPPVVRIRRNRFKHDREE